MRYLLLSVLVVSLVGILMLTTGAWAIHDEIQEYPRGISNTIYYHGVIKEQIKSGQGIFYVNEVKTEILTDKAQRIIIDVTYKNTQNETETLLGSAFDLSDNQGTIHKPDFHNFLHIQPNDNISAKLEYVIGSNLSPMALIHVDYPYENGVVIDLTRVASSPDQRPKTELKSNNDVFTNGDFELMVSNESLTGSNPTIYSVEVKITNISGKTNFACLSNLHVKDPEGFVYEIDTWKSDWPGPSCGDLYPGEKMGGMSVFPIHSNPDQIMLVYDPVRMSDEPINTGLRAGINSGSTSTTSSTPIPTPLPTIHSTVLTLDSIPSKVKVGDKILFSGTLKTTDGNIVQGATITIKDTKFGVIGTLETDDSGKFAGTWEIEEWNAGVGYSFYVVYDGSSNIKDAKSKTHMVTAISSTPSPTPTAETSIPSWIKNSAGWWADGQIDDGSFVSGIQWLITNGIMTIPPTEQGAGSGDVIPSWIKNNAEWWADGQINDSSFVSGLQWLISNGIMKIS